MPIHHPNSADIMPFSLNFNVMLMEVKLFFAPENALKNAICTDIYVLKQILLHLPEVKDVVVLEGVVAVVVDSATASEKKTLTFTALKRILIECVILRISGVLPSK